MFGGEETVAEFLLEIAMQIEFGSAWVDHDFSSVVVEKEGHVHALGGHFDPFAASALPSPFPDYGAKVVTRAGGDGREHGVRPHSLTAEFDHPHRCAANFGGRSIEDKLTALQEAESIKEKIESRAESDGAPDDEVCGVRMK